MGTDTLTRSKYSGMDFDTYSDDLRARLQVKFAADFNDFAISSMGIVLMDMVAYGLDTLSFYLDQRVTDLYLTTARTRGAVSRLTRQLGYKMYPAVASSVDLDISLKKTYPFDVTLFKGFKFEGPNGLVFETADDLTFPANTPTSTKKSISCYEGETLTETFVSNGSTNQVFKLRRVPEEKFVVSGTVKVVVDGSTWSEKEFLQFEASNHFEVGYNDDPPTVRFGNGKAGNLPASGASISVSYVASRGKAGQVAKNTIQKELLPLVVNFQTISLSVNNPTGSVGGDDPESLEQAKLNAPKVFKARQVAVTRSDYEALANTYAHPLFGRVAVAQALSTKSSGNDVELQNQLTLVSNAVSTPVSATKVLITAAQTDSASISTQLTAIQNATTNIGTKNTAASTSVESALTDARTLKNTNQEIANDVGTITSIAGTGGSLRALVDGFTVAGTSQITYADKTALTEYLDTLKSEAESVGVRSSAIGSKALSVIGSLGDAKDRLSEVGVGTYAATTELGKIDSARTAASTANASVSSNVTGISTALTDAYTVVNGALASINDHFDTIYSGDCKTNVVTVPILTRDGGGFYTAPSSGLIRSLQEFLDARKEVTQSVVVTSGANYLVPAKLTVRVGVLPNFNVSTIQAVVSAKIDNLLRDRKFKQSLYVSDVEEVIYHVAGVEFANVIIEGHLDTDGASVLTSKVDASGNLIASEADIITKGAVTVTVETVTL